MWPPTKGAPLQTSNREKRAGKRSFQRKWGRWKNEEDPGAIWEGVWDNRGHPSGHGEGRESPERVP